MSAVTIHDYSLELFLHPNEAALLALAIDESMDSMSQPGQLGELKLQLLQTLGSMLKSGLSACLLKHHADYEALAALDSDLFELLGVVPEHSAPVTLPD